jgi:hypothetical protein
VVAWISTVFIKPAPETSSNSRLVETNPCAILLQITPEKAIVLHDLVHEFTRDRLEDNVPRLNALLLEANRAGRSWHELIDDAYWNKNLEWHHAAAKQWNDLAAIYVDPVLREKQWPVCYFPGVGLMGDPSGELGRVLQLVPGDQKPEVVDAICRGLLNRARELLREIRWNGSAEMGARLGALKAADLKDAGVTEEDHFVILGQNTGLAWLRDLLYSFVFYCHQAVAVERQRIDAGVAPATGSKRVFRDASDIFCVLCELDANPPDNISGQLSDQAYVVVGSWPG